MRLPTITPLFALLLLGFAPPDSGPVTPSSQDNTGQQPEIKQAHRVRPRAAVRLGGVYTLGLSSNGAPLEESAALGKPLSAETAHWIADNCDVIALNAVVIGQEDTHEDSCSLWL